MYKRLLNNKLVSGAFLISVNLSGYLINVIDLCHNVRGNVLLVGPEVKVRLALIAGSAGLNI
jgi:hypothetical protein